LRPLILGWGAETGLPVIVVVAKNDSVIFPRLISKRFAHVVDEDGRDCWAMVMMFGWGEESLFVVNW
jgi:hypothetical protein